MSNEKKILIGLLDDTIYVSEFCWKDNFNREGEEHASITGDGYDIQFFNEEEGEEMAEDSLSDGELWKMCVQDGQTTQGLEEWSEQVLLIDGWESVIGDVLEIDNDVYTMWSCGGCIHEIYSPEKRTKFTDLKLTMEEMETIWQFTKRLHIRRISNYTKEEKDLYSRVCEIFKKYPKFKSKMLLQYKDFEEE